ncbi:MAG: hypothetical protein QOJ99_3025 [Bryobacterales bacterium]|nr:hypothetical protein [Bryobacterales bacterium]
MRITELLSVTISVDPLEIEHLLDALAKLPHHINPNLRYEEWATHVEFPAWRSWLDDLEGTIAREGFDSARLSYRPAVVANGEDVVHSAWLTSEDTCRTKQLLR